MQITQTFGLTGNRTRDRDNSRRIHHHCATGAQFNRFYLNISFSKAGLCQASNLRSPEGELNSKVEQAISIFAGTNIQMPIIIALVILTSKKGIFFLLCLCLFQLTFEKAGTISTGLLLADS